MLLMGTILQNIFFSIIGKFRRCSAFITFCIVAVYSGMADSRHAADYMLYFNSYTYRWKNFEHGYLWLTGISYNHGLTYLDFRMVSICITYLLFFVLTCLLTKNVALVAAVYVVTSYAIDVSQIRNVMVIPFMLLAIYILIKKIKFSYFFAMAVLILGATIHTLSLSLILIPIIIMLKKYWEQSFGKLLFVILIFANLVQFSAKRLFLSFAIKFVSLVGFRSNLIANLQGAYSSGTEFTPWVLSTMVVISCIWLFNELTKRSRIQKKINFSGIEPELFNSSILIGEVSLFLMCIGLILMTMSVDYIRLIRIAFVLFTIFLGNILIMLNKTQKVIYISAFIVISCLMLYTQINHIYLIQNDIPYLFHFINPNVLTR